MKKIIKNYCGVILLYSVIIFGAIILNTRFQYLNEINEKGDNSSLVAVKEK